MARRFASLFSATVLVAGVLSASVASAQSFSSGSTGADGALDLATMNCPNQICEVQLPPNGVLNYTTVTIPAGKTLVFRKNLNNTPVVMLAQGQVQIHGNVYVTGPRCYDGNANPRLPGPGGFTGGDYNQPGFGPGGGTAPSLDGRWVGPLSLVPIIGGSGGGGGTGNQGTGGGGAIVVASSGSIVITGSGFLSAMGGCGTGSFAGAGGGGAIRLVANAVNLTGSLYALPGGVVRVEAPQGSLVFNGSSNPAAVLSDINPAIFASAPTSLSITSVGGFAVPAYSGQRFDTVDVLLPTQLPDPIDVVVSASNIPLGTPVGITFGTTNAGTVVPGALTGTLQSSTATVQVSGLNRQALAYLFVSATFAVPSAAAPAGPAGVDRVAQVRVTAPPGGAPRYEFLRADGSVVDQARLPEDFLRHFQR